MTRKDFQLIADVLRDTNASPLIVLAFATELATTNPRFDRERFLQVASQPI